MGAHVFFGSISALKPGTPQTEDIYIIENFSPSLLRGPSWTSDFFSEITDYLAVLMSQ
jgi:hypothetical protein